MQTNKKNIFTTKLFLCFFASLITIIICWVPASTVQAEVKIVNPKQTYYLSSTNLEAYDPDYAPQFIFEIKVSGGDSIVENSIRSSNDKVTQFSVKEYPTYNIRKSEDGKTYYLDAGQARYPGIANISFEDQTGKQYTVTAEVLPYENPIESIKVTNIEKGKNFAKKVNKRDEYYTRGRGRLLTFSKKTIVPKITVKAKKGWTIKTISVGCGRGKDKFDEYDYEKWGKKKISNINARTKTVKLKKVDKGDGLVVTISLENNENGAFQRVSFGDSYYLFYD